MSEKLHPATAAALRGLGNSYEEWWSDPKERADYHKALFVLEIIFSMHDQGVSQSELAAKWGKSRQYVSKLLNFKTNVTIQTMVELTILLNLDLRIEVSPHRNAFSCQPPPSLTSPAAT